MRPQTACLLSVYLLQYQALSSAGCRSLPYEGRPEEHGERCHGPLTVYGGSAFPNSEKEVERCCQHDYILVVDAIRPEVAKRTDVALSGGPVPELDTPCTCTRLKHIRYTESNNPVIAFSKITSARKKKSAAQCGSNNPPILVFDGTIPYPELAKHRIKLQYSNPDKNLKLITAGKTENYSPAQHPLFLRVVCERESSPEKRTKFGYRAPHLEKGDWKRLHKRNKSTSKCLAEGPLMVISERLAYPEKGAVTKRSADEYDLASVPWQTLWLLEAPEGECGVRVKETVLRLEAAQHVLHRPQQPLGRCPVRFRPHADPNRWLPSNLVVAECVCEGSPCGRLGTHVCITVYAVRNVFSLQGGRRRVLLAVGCLCALQNARLSKLRVPQIVA